MNEAEGAFFDHATAAGWAVTKRGWPDFFCMKEDGTVCMVEVKKHEEQRLTREQCAVMRYLQSVGVKVFRWSPDAGFTLDFE